MRKSLQNAQLTGHSDYSLGRSDEVIPKPFDSIDGGDIQALVANQVPESRVIEYKRELPGHKDEQKKEFLADISSFANAAGGDIVYGIAEKRDRGGNTGLPEQVCGLEGISADSEIQRMHMLVRDGTQPRVHVQCRAVACPANKFVILVRIPRSWVLPHAVVHGKTFRFYSRISTGKYPLDVDELRSLFQMSADQGERIRRFRDERLATVLAGETPVPLGDGAKTVLHAVPLEVGFPGNARDVTPNVSPQQSLLTPVFGGASSYRYNIDGFLCCGGSISNGAHRGYTQVFRSGAVESVGVSDSGVSLDIAAGPFEGRLMPALSDYLCVQRIVGVSPPIVVMVTLLGVKGYRLKATALERWGDDSHPIDRDLILLPDVIVEEYGSQELDVILRPVFDALWQACGLNCCKHYGENGRLEGIRLI